MVPYEFIITFCDYSLTHGNTPKKSESKSSDTFFCLSVCRYVSSAKREDSKGFTFRYPYKTNIKLAVSVVVGTPKERVCAIAIRMKSYTAVFLILGTCYATLTFGTIHKLQRKNWIKVHFE